MHPSRSIYAENLGWEPHICHFLALGSPRWWCTLQIKWKFWSTDELINPRVSHLALNGRTA
jgi:hypothetical protein